MDVFDNIDVEQFKQLLTLAFQVVVGGFVFSCLPWMLGQLIQFCTRFFEDDRGEV